MLVSRETHWTKVLQGLGEGGTVHSLYSEEWREDSGGCETEDPAIDDSQSKRWRGG